MVLPPEMQIFPANEPDRVEHFHDGRRYESVFSENSDAISYGPTLNRPLIVVQWLA